MQQMAQQQLCVDLSQVIGEVRQQIEHIADTILSHSRYVIEWLFDFCMKFR